MIVQVFAKRWIAPEDDFDLVRLEFAQVTYGGDVVMCEDAKVCSTDAGNLSQCVWVIRPASSHKTA